MCPIFFVFFPCSIFTETKQSISSSEKGQACLNLIFQTMTFNLKCEDNLSVSSCFLQSHKFSPGFKPTDMLDEKEENTKRTSFFWASTECRCVVVWRTLSPQMTRRVDCRRSQISYRYVLFLFCFSVISLSIQTADTNYLNFSACLSFFLFFKLLFDIYLGIYLCKIFQQHDPLQV